MQKFGLCVTMGRLLNLSEPGSPYLWTEWYDPTEEELRIGSLVKAHGFVLAHRKPEQTGSFPSLPTLNTSLGSRFSVSLSLAVSALPFTLKLLPPTSFHPDAPEKEELR